MPAISDDGHRGSSGLLERGAIGKTAKSTVSAGSCRSEKRSIGNERQRRARGADY